MLSKEEPHHYLTSTVQDGVSVCTIAKVAGTTWHEHFLTLGNILETFTVNLNSNLVLQHQLMPAVRFGELESRSCGRHLRKASGLPSVIQCN